LLAGRGISIGWCAANSSVKYEVDASVYITMEMLCVLWPILLLLDLSSQLVGPVMRFLWVRTKSNPKITKEKVVGLVV